MKTLAAGALFVVLIIVALGLAAILYLSLATFPFNARAQLPLPAAIGGTIDVDVQSELSFAPLRLEAFLTGRAAISEDALNAALPAEAYSILESSVDSPRIASLLGRLAFVKDSVRISFTDADVIVAGDFAGQFFVRERMPEDAIELPGAGESVPVSGRIEASIERPHLGRDWTAGFDGIRTSLALDESTVASLAGKFGYGNEFSGLLSDLLNARLAGHVGRFEAAQLDLRSRIGRHISAAQEQYGKITAFRQVKNLEITSVKVDSCPQLEQGRLSLGFAARVSHSLRTRDEPARLPDLELAETSCPNGWSLRP